MSLPRTLFSSLASNIQEAEDRVDLGAYRVPESSEAPDWGTEHPPPPTVRRALLERQHVLRCHVTTAGCALGGQRHLLHRRHCLPAWLGGLCALWRLAVPFLALGSRGVFPECLIMLDTSWARDLGGENVARLVSAALPGTAKKTPAGPQLTVSTCLAVAWSAWLWCSLTTRPAARVQAPGGGDADRMAQLRVWCAAPRFVRGHDDLCRADHRLHHGVGLPAAQLPQVQPHPEGGGLVFVQSTSCCRPAADVRPIRPIQMSASNLTVGLVALELVNARLTLFATFSLCFLCLLPQQCGLPLPGIDPIAAVASSWACAHPVCSALLPYAWLHLVLSVSHILTANRLCRGRQSRLLYSPPTPAYPIGTRGFLQHPGRCSCSC